MASDPATIDDEASYRSLHAPAVVALVLALAGGVAMLAPVAWPIALVALAVGLLAYGAIARSPETLTGGAVAALAVGLSVVVLTAVFARGVVAGRLHAADASRVADRFLELLAEGDDVGALELTLAHGSRRATREAAGLLYSSNEEAKKRLTEFGAKPAIVGLKSKGAGAPRLVERTAARNGPGKTVSVVHLYDLDSDGAEARRTVALTLRRDPPQGVGRPAWRVADFDFAAPTR
ncbi:MAG: hypothetical protein ACRCT8_11610 [Lacipirellulaceae bacterium]